jgi:hypothetical protein
MSCYILPLSEKISIISPQQDKSVIHAFPPNGTLRGAVQGNVPVTDAIIIFYLFTCLRLVMNSSSVKAQLVPSYHCPCSCKQKNNSRNRTARERQRPAVPCFSTLSRQQRDIRKNVTEHKMCVLIFSTNFV